MRKNIFGRQFKRDTNERKALFKGLASSLVLHERIQTTEEKAKAVKPLVEKLVTTAKKGDLKAHSLLQPYLNAQALKKMMEDTGPRFKDRPGGYTRIIKIGPRLQDNASVVILEWVEKPVITAVISSKDKPVAKVTSEKVEAKASIAKAGKETKGTNGAKGDKKTTKKTVKKAAAKKETK